MLTDLYIFKNGTLKRKENTIYLEDSDGNKKAIPVEIIERIHLFGEIGLNSKLLNFLSQYDILVNFYNYYGFYIGTFYPRKKRISGFLVVHQAKHFLDIEKRLFIAKAFVIGAVHHMKRNLRRYKETEEFISRIEEMERKAMLTVDVSELMGYEGKIRNIYYSAFDNILKSDLEFKKRTKRPPTNPINALISFGNSLMYSTILGEIYKTQLDPSISFLHEPSTKRFSLVLDLSEIFKPLIVDSTIFKLVNNKMISQKSFDNFDGICFLNEEGKKAFIKVYEDKLKTTIKHRKLNRKVSYRTFIRLECYKLIKHFIEDEIYKPLKAWW